MRLRDRSRVIMLKKTDDTLVYSQFDVALRAEGGIGGDRDSQLLAKLDNGLLSEVGMELDLKDLGLIFSIAEDVEEQ